MSNIYKAGTKPPSGSYVCTDCKGEKEPHTILVPSMEVKLPVCPKCGNKLWMKF